MALPIITKIFYRSDFTIELPLAEGYDGQEFRFTIYTCGEIENGWVASYIDGVYTNCSVENDIVTIYVNNNNQMNPGCVTVQSEYDYFNSHFIDNEDNVKDVYKTNIYLVSYKTNAFSASFRPSNLPDLTDSSEYVTFSYLTTTLEDYVTDEELQSQLEDFVTEEDFAAELSNYITDEELTDMGFLTQSEIDQMGYVSMPQLTSMSYATVAYLNEKLSSKQNVLVSGQNIKTINGYSLLGSGDLVIEGGSSIDLSSYVTKDELSQAGYVTSSDISDFVTEQDVQNILVEGSYITSNELSQMSYVTDSQLQQAAYINTQYLDQASYTTLQEVSQQGFTTANDFKTINGYSLIGEGNIVISGGGSIDLSAYVTKDELSAAGYLTTVPSEYVTESELSSMDYVTQSQLSANSYITINDVPVVDLSSYVTKDELDSYVTKTELDNASYVTTSDLNTELGDYPTNNDLALTLQDYVSYSQFNTYTSDFVVDNDLEDLVSKDELSQAGYVTNTSLQSQLQQAGYLTSIPSEYVTESQLQSTLTAYITESELSSMGYITSSALPTMSDYVSKTELSQAGYLTSIPSEYITESELSSMGYITSIPNNYATYDAISQMGYVTDTALQSQLQQAGYITSSEIPTIPVIDENLIPNTTATYTLGDSTHFYDATYTNNWNLPNNGGFIKVNNNNRVLITSTSMRPSVNNYYSLGISNNQWSYTYSANFIEDGTNIKDIYATKVELPKIDESLIPNTTLTYTLGDSTHFYANTYMSDVWLGTKNKFSNRSDNQVNLQLNNAWRYVFHSNNFSPAGNNTQSLGQTSTQWSYTYSANFIENGTNIKDIYTKAYVLTQNQYDGLSQADKDKETIYIISDQQAYMNNELVTETSLDSRGFLTAANFNYDPTTGTLTLNL